MSQTKGSSNRAARQVMLLAVPVLLTGLTCSGCVGVGTGQSQIAAPPSTTSATSASPAPCPAQPQGTTPTNCTPATKK